MDELQSHRYGRTKIEAKKELQLLDAYFFGIGGPADIQEAYNSIKNDIGLLTLLDDIAKERLISEKNQTVFLNTSTHCIKRVKELLFNEERFPYEIYEGVPEESRELDDDSIDDILDGFYRNVMPNI